MYCKHSKNYSLANPSVLSPIRNASNALMIICLWGAKFSILDIQMYNVYYEYIFEYQNMNLFLNIKSVLWCP